MEEGISSLVSVSLLHPITDTPKIYTIYSNILGYLHLSAFQQNPVAVFVSTTKYCDSTEGLLSVVEYVAFQV